MEEKGEKMTDSDKITETKMQAILMNWVMNERHHLYTVPNSTVIFNWESDLISVTKALLTHEFEIKISLADFRKDAKKKSKHSYLTNPNAKYIPNYFWYATYGDFEIEPPAHAGWIKITKTATWYNLAIKKDAPRLTDRKLSEQKQFDIARLLSFRLTNIYRGYLQSGKTKES